MYVENMTFRNSIFSLLGIFLSACSLSSSLESFDLSSTSREGNSLNELDIIADNPVIGKSVPLSIIGGQSPYSIKIISGLGEINEANLSVRTTIPGNIEVEVTDSAGIKKSKTISFSDNNSLTTGLVNFSLSQDWGTLFYSNANGIYKKNLLSSNSNSIAVVENGKNCNLISLTSCSITSLITFEIDDSGNKIAFTAQINPGYRGLFSINSNGTSMTKLSGDYSLANQGIGLISNSFASGQKLIAFTPGGRIVYRDGEQEVSGDIEPWMRTVNSDGTDRKLVHPNMSNFDGAQVENYTFNGNNSKVFFLSDPGASSITSLYVTNTDGSSNTSWIRISPAGLDLWGAMTSKYTLTPDETKIIFSLDTVVGMILYNNLYICNTSGSGCFTQVYSGYARPSIFNAAGSLMLIDNTTTYYLASTSANSKVDLGALESPSFLSNGNILSLRTVSGVKRIYSAPANISGITWTQLNPSFPAFANITSMKTFGAKIYFIADDLQDGVFRLHRMNQDGSGYEVVNNIQMELSSSSEKFTIDSLSSDASRVLLVKQEQAVTWYGYAYTTNKDLYMADLNTNRLVKLTDRKISGSAIGSIKASPDLRKIVYQSDQNQLSAIELFYIEWPF